MATNSCPLVWWIHAMIENDRVTARVTVRTNEKEANPSLSLIYSFYKSELRELIPEDVWKHKFTLINAIGKLAVQKQELEDELKNGLIELESEKRFKEALETFKTEPFFTERLLLEAKITALEWLIRDMITIDGGRY